MNFIEAHVEFGIRNNLKITLDKSKISIIKDDMYFVSSYKDLPVVSQGDTKEEAYQNLIHAIEIYFEEVLYNEVEKYKSNKL